MSNTDDAENTFLGRWSRRKQQSKIEEQDGAQPPVPTEQSITEQQVEIEDAALLELPEEEESSADEEILTDEDMVPLESLDADSDYSPFFSEGVSKQLRNMALKKLFFSGKFASRDGLDDYDDDFTKFEPLGDTVTSDMKFHQRRKERARLAKLEEERLEEEKRLAAEENSELPEDPETLEATDQPSEEESAEDSIEGTDEDEQPDTLIEITEGSVIQETPVGDKNLPQIAEVVSANDNAQQEHSDHRSNQIKPSGDDSNNPDRKNT